MPSFDPAPLAISSALRRAARAVRVARARSSFAEFAHFVLKDEATGEPLHLSPMHKEWCQLLAGHDRLQLLSFVESGKSNLVSIGWTLWSLGRNPSMRACIISNTATQAQKLLRSVAQHIERNPELHAVFPALRPGSPWNESSITIERPTVSKDPTLLAAGLHGAVLGSRLDLLIADDVLDFESTRTATGRTTSLDWLQSTAFSRLTSKARVVVVGTPWHAEDLHARLEKRGWPTHKFPIENSEGEPSWPERWSPARITQKRLELGPAQSARQLDVTCTSADSASIDEAWLAMALRRGSTEATRLRVNASGQPYWLSRPTWPARVLVGLDPSLGGSDKSDLSAIAVIYIRPDGSREVLEISSGRWSGPEILARVDSAHERFNPARIVVEGNGSQSFLLHFARERGTRLPVESFVTGRGQASLQWLAERFATELAAARWVLPAVDGVPSTGELRALVRDLMIYSPRDHVPDRVAALLLATTAIEASAQRAGWFRIPNLIER